MIIKNFSLFLQLSDNLVHDWSSLAQEEQIPLNDSMITFGLKLAIVTMLATIYVPIK